MKSLFSFDRFKLVYWIIAIATALHTAWGAATTMQGKLPDDSALQFAWWLQGFGFAIAIDISMVMVATKVRNGGSTVQWFGIGKLRVPINWYAITFIAVAALSSYFQLLYAWAHTTELTNGGGIATLWIDRLQALIDARIIIAPFALPVIAILYTIGGLGKGGEAQSKQRNVAMQPQSPRNVDASDAIKIDREQRQPIALLGAPQPQMLRDGDGKLTGYICPGCNSQLSISGWSRHKKTCQHLNVEVQ